jgi:hypothetical protein
MMMKMDMDDESSLSQRSGKGGNNIQGLCVSWAFGLHVKLSSKDSLHNNKPIADGCLGNQTLNRTVTHLKFRITTAMVTSQRVSWITCF